MKRISLFFILLFIAIPCMAQREKHRFNNAYDVFWEYNETTHKMIISGNDYWMGTNSGSFENLRCDTRELLVIGGVKNIVKNSFYHPDYYGNGIKTLNKVIIEEGTEIIESSAFKKCENLKLVSLPSTIKSIDFHAFYGCKSLDTISFPASIRQIGQAAFRYTGISEVNITSPVEFLGTHTFADCGKLERAVIATKSTSNYMFYNCHHLRYVEIVSGENLSESMFSGCRKLDTIVLDFKAKKLPPLFGIEKPENSTQVVVIIPNGTLKHYIKIAKKDKVNNEMLRFVERSNRIITEALVDEKTTRHVPPQNKKAEENNKIRPEPITKPCYRIWFGDGYSSSEKNMLYYQFDTLPMERFKPFSPIESYSGLQKEKYNNGEYYGNIVNSKRHGIGKYSWTSDNCSGDWYIGNWQDGKRTGLGEYHWSNGNIYIGYFYESGRTGMGMFIWNDAEDIYIGEFKDEIREGFGCYYWKPKRSSWRLYCGDFINNSLSGHGIVVKDDASYLYGVFENDSYKGQPEVISLDEFFRFPEVLPWNIIAKNYIEQEINKWQQKGEFEKTYDWQQRVNEASRKKKIKELADELRVKYLKNFCPKIRLHLELGKYDADNETFLVSDSIYGNMIVSLTEEASPMQFKESWNRIIAVPCYYFTGETIGIKEIDFYLNGYCVAKYDNSASRNYKIINIDYNFDPISIPEYTINRNGRSIIDTVTIGKADVDINIPVGKISNNNTYAFIVANENYQIKNVPFAHNDGRIFAKYCKKTLGIPQDHILVYEDATCSNIIECFDKMKWASLANNGQVNIIFYYAGHAFPDEETHYAYLLPVDGNVHIKRTCYSLGQMYKDFNNIEANSIVCFLDACFSGASRDDNMVIEGRGVAIKPKEERPLGNVVVFSASSDAETAHQYQEQDHGLFTYFLLKKLQDSKGDITLGELADYLVTNVRKTSFDKNKKIQTPTYISSPKIETTWRDIKL